MRIYILEDELDRLPRSGILRSLRNHTITIGRSFEEAILNYKGPYDILLLDHDMRGFMESDPEYPNTGYQFCKWLISHIKEPYPKVILHSQNPSGRKRMRKLLVEAGFAVREFAFCDKYVKFLEGI